MSDHRWKTLDTAALLQKRNQLREFTGSGNTGGGIFGAPVRGGVSGVTTSANVGAYPVPIGGRKKKKDR